MTKRDGQQNSRCWHFWPLGSTSSWVSCTPTFVKYEKDSRPKLLIPKATHWSCMYGNQTWKMRPHFHGNNEQYWARTLLRTEPLHRRLSSARPRPIPVGLRQENDVHSWHTCVNQLRWLMYVIHSSFSWETSYSRVYFYLTQFCPFPEQANFIFKFIFNF